jgi:hypothetical protein
MSLFLFWLKESFSILGVESLSNNVTVIIFGREIVQN